MRNKAQHSRSDNTSQAGRQATALSSRNRTWRLVISVLLIVHLTAVIVAPFAFAAAGPEIRSPFAYGILSWFRPYIQSAFLDHGYFFFAPNPGPSHLLRVRATHEDGRQTIETFPDRRRQFPRLLYHRHFMLSEQLNAMFTPPTAPPVPQDSPVYRQWESDRRAYEARRNSFLDHLRWRYRTDHVQLTRVEHRSPTPDEFLRGIRLTDPSLYADLPENPELELISPEPLP